MIDREALASTLCQQKYKAAKILCRRCGAVGTPYFYFINIQHPVMRALWQQYKRSLHIPQPVPASDEERLRFEVGLPLYGDELGADITPIMAGLGFFVKLDKDEFIGKDAVAKQKAEGAPMKLVGLELEGKAIPRHGYDVLNAEGDTVGSVTTGYHAISVDKSIAMAFVKPQYAALDTPLSVRIRKKTFPAVVVKKKFYKKSYKK